jgi:hypothetical protein
MNLAMNKIVMLKNEGGWQHYVTDFGCICHFQVNADFEGYSFQCLLHLACVGPLRNRVGRLYREELQWAF